MRAACPIVLALVVALILFSPLEISAAATYIPVGDEIYPLLDRLEAEGVIVSGLLNTRPISRDEAKRLLREAEASSAADRPVIKEMVASLGRRLGPSATERSKTGFRATMYARYINADTPLQLLQYNNDGDMPTKGSNYRTGIDLRVEHASLFAIDVNPEYRSNGSRDAEVTAPGGGLSTIAEPAHEEVIRHGYIVMGLAKLDMVLGKDSQWWGPGRHGSILLSNNAEPFTMVRLTNPEPLMLPWIFRNLGNFKFTLFATQLERDRDYSKPYFWGMRFDFRPSATIEVGLQRTAIFGGEGRPDNLSIWRKSLLPFFDSENTGGLNDPGDQRAGFDLKLNFPNSFQPVQVYLEGDGEDEKNNLPNLWAWVGGVYLPRIGTLDRVDFRFELGTTMGRRLSPTVWYNHSIYTDGYTYHDRIIGHHIGTDSRDLYFEFSYHLPEHDARFFLAYDREEHHVREGDFQEIGHEAIGGGDITLSRHWGLSAAYNHAWVRNVGNQFSPMRQISSFNGLVRYTF